jgi:hypothetical protein
MNEYGPYKRELTYEIAACLRMCDMEPSDAAEELGRTVAHLQD